MDMLGDDGYTCSYAQSVEEAMPWTWEPNCRIAIVEMDLGEKPGPQVAWEMRRYHPDLAILLVGSPGQLGFWHADDLEDLGIDHVLAKPFASQALRDAVTTSIANRSRRARQRDVSPGSRVAAPVTALHEDAAALGALAATP